ncbi:Fe2+-dependent dioxygenase [Sphingomonas sp. LY160]|uniref:Fe2+-dependent dioxygenase n=1 Tax=Sphingomonas sp. LY160 TaxID=3095342 RepID=UPI002ADEB1F9|nr:Fe2+-dependent dioxygenase [Sphingomonas sp. LY160]MEA1072652.1 Fe2+-dependent dioxygenase [Sphingomonas sp. LY160]
MYRILSLLDAGEIAECRRIAARTQFIDGRASNPHNKAKNNQQLHDAEAGQTSSQLLLRAFARSEEFREFAFPLRIAPPMLTRYQPGMHYGLHADAAFLNIGQTVVRSDLSCTVFLSDPSDYDGGALHVMLGDASLRFRLQPGEAIIYPSDTFHEVEPVTRGERLVAISFIESQIADPFRRNLLFDLNEVAALEGLSMQPENYSRLQLVQQRLLRHWAERP